MIVTSTTNVSSQQIADLVITAFEGGITYWCESCDCGSAYQKPATYDGPFEWTLKLHDEDDDVTLTPEKIQTGLQKLADDFPTIFNRCTDEDGDYDGDDADIFMQLCLFGEVVYG
jgi:hypothetical protein